MNNRQLRITAHRLVFGLFVTALLLLVSCSKEMTPSDTLPQGKYPMTFTSVVNGLTVAKSTTDNQWTGTEEVAIEIGSKVNKYVAAATGELSAASDGTPFYWQSTTQKMSVAAWYPYNGGVRPTSFAVQADQSGSGYQTSDLIYAPSVEVTYRGSEGLTFNHLPVKVVVNLKSGEGVAQADVEGATVSIVSQPLTSGAIDANWSVTQATSGSSEITSNVQGSVAIGYHKTIQALLVPQKSTAEGRFIKVTAAGSDYYYSTALDFNAGKQYTYNITVQKNGLSVEASGAAGWSGTDTEIVSKDIATGFAASDLKVGDYYYSDGKWSDGGYREYTDLSTAILPVMPVLTSVDGAERSVLGIVLKVGVDDMGDSADNCTYQTKDGGSLAVQGYVLALNDAPTNISGDSCQWSVEGIKVDLQRMNRSETLFCGYDNTNAIKEFAALNDMDLQSDFPATYYASVGYETNYPTPATSSNWFLPSQGQCQYWRDNKSVILASIKRATGNPNYGWQEKYWSSSEHTSIPKTMAWREQLVGFEGIGSHNKTKKINVRSILAF